MISTGGHPTFHGRWTPEMDHFAELHETELIKALNEAEGWTFMVSAVVVVDFRPAILYSKRDQLPLDSDQRVHKVRDLIQEIRMEAGLNGIVVMGDPNAHWSAGWSYHGVPNG